MTLDRRTLLKGGLAAGALLAAGSPPALARPLTTTHGIGAERRSTLSPGRRLVHADLHNHSHLSDGTGDPMLVHERLRAAGVDVAALTDHTVAAFAFDRDVCAPVPNIVGERNECRALFGMSAGGWERTKSLAKAFALDLDLGPELAGTPAAVQVLRPGTQVPEVVEVLGGVAGSRISIEPYGSKRRNPVRFSVPFDHPCNDWGLAYSSPWWLGERRRRH